MRVGGDGGGGEVGAAVLHGGGDEGAVVRGRRGAAEEEATACSASASSTSRGSSARGSSGVDSVVNETVHLDANANARDKTQQCQIRYCPGSCAGVVDWGRITNLTRGSLPRPPTSFATIKVDGLLLPSEASAGSTEPQEEDDAPLQGVKDNRWVRAQLQGQTKIAVPRPTGECQDKRNRLGAVLFQDRKDRAQRPASLDFGCPGVAKSSAHSPGFPVNGVGVMNKGMGVSYSSHCRPEVLSSPGTPSYHRRGMTVVGYQRGPNSERVIPPPTGHRRHPGSSTVPSHSSGRTLPSKWEDAERWIFSPNPGNAVGRSVPQLWRPKSKSGPLGPPGRYVGPWSSSSSSTLFLESGRVGNLTVNSPYLDGVLLPDQHIRGGFMDSGRDVSAASGEDSSNGRGGRSSETNGQYPAMRSTRVSLQFSSAADSYQSLPTSYESIQDGQIESIKDSATSSTPMVLRKDVATQTSPDISRIEGEEAKMTAWENMQKANAEAAIQKLVIKLEKKRPYSLERIFNTLRSGPRKTQVVRSTSTANHDQHISRTIKTAPHLSKNGQMSSLSGCFTCHAF
nr:unnamed protein product [Digitaria exilis]